MPPGPPFDIRRVAWHQSTLHRYWSGQAVAGRLHDLVPVRQPPTSVLVPVPEVDDCGRTRPFALDPEPFRLPDCAVRDIFPGWPDRSLRLPHFRATSNGLGQELHREPNELLVISGRPATLHRADGLVRRDLR